MKSAYELAMERLSKSDPRSSPALTAAQRAALAEIDRVFTGRIAEREIFLRQRLEQALAGKDADEVDKIRKQITGERARLEEEREAEKDRVRGAKA
jgi:hypothetical protein